jgi:hypothetical protein
MSQENFPFFESSEAATKHAIQASGRDMKEVAKALWPDKTVDAGRTALLNALNENRSERLTAGQHIFIAKHCGRFDWLYFVCHQLSHTRPIAVTPAEQVAELQQLLFRKAAELKPVLEQIEKLRVITP